MHGNAIKRQNDFFIDQEGGILLTVFKWLNFLISILSIAAIGSCSFPMKLALLLLISASSGFFVGASLIKGKSSFLAQKMDKNSAEAQSILSNALERRGIGYSTPKREDVTPIKINDVLGSPMLIVLVVAVGFMLMLHPDYMGLQVQAMCTYPSFKRIALVLGQYICFAFAITGIYVNIISKRKL
jgi:hypothetical protein